MPSANKNPGAAGKDLPFEEAVQKLEAVVEAMEAGDLPLEGLLAQFEEGTRLVRICQGKLEEAELKIQKIERSAGGEPVLKPLDEEPSPHE
ncbi:MAG TPA: exodeoxyribonuclease VII small subunit [Methylomirabilota bacterium]|nr:exodeoxyribonuclease VII small subunit [Methylomirabilota bacterium]